MVNKHIIEVIQVSAYLKKYFERTKFMINIRPIYIIPFSSEVKQTMHDF